MSTTILWLRQDLRLSDNPALRAARGAEKLIPLYIHDPKAYGNRPPGAAANWWLHHSLEALGRELHRRGSGLILRSGCTAEIFDELTRSGEVTRICWNRRYEPAAMHTDRDLKTTLRANGMEVQSFNANLLFEPWEIQRAASGAAAAPYRVFTPYWRACLRHGLPGVRDARPDTLPPMPEGIRGLPLTDLNLLPRHAWDAGLRSRWRPGEQGALAQLEQFLDAALADYPSTRDQPAVAGTSALSPHLHFGEIGPRQVVQAAQQLHAHGVANGPGIDALDSFVREIGWREFAHHLLFHFPHSEQEPLNGRFAAFPWRRDYAEDLVAWQRGETGIPLVDAGMRELWHTGWMHNRVRMITASFLTKNLLIPWQEGAAWFWDTLVDADLANNTAGWQWVAGSGADAAPYFRVFNPVLQGEKFDPDGRYVRQWLPELNALPDRYVHKPWSTPASLGVDRGAYPAPIVDLKASRERALAAYKSLP